MNKKISFTVIITIFLIIIVYVTYRYSVTQIIKTYGTLILASIALFAIFYPSINKFVKKPKFSIDFDFHEEWNNELRLIIKNIGKSLAHSCKVYIEVYDDSNNTKLKYLFLPWDMPNYSVMIPGKAQYVPVTYDVINLYAKEYQFVKLFFYFHTNIFSFYGSSFYEGGNMSPPLVATNSVIKITPVLDICKVYRIAVSVFSEEVSYIELKTLYFKIIKNGSSYLRSFKKSDMNIEIK